MHIFYALSPRTVYIKLPNLFSFSLENDDMESSKRCVKLVSLIFINNNNNNNNNSNDNSGLYSSQDKNTHSCYIVNCYFYKVRMEEKYTYTITICMSI